MKYNTRDFHVIVFKNSLEFMYSSSFMNKRFLFYNYRGLFQIVVYTRYGTNI